MDTLQVPLSTLSETAATQPQEASPAVVTALLSIAKSTRAFTSLKLAEIGLHPGQDQLIDRLPPGVPVSVSVLAQQLSVRASTVSKMLDRLIERGLLRRLADQSDARRTMVQLTAEGEKAQVAVRDIWNRLERELTSSLAADDLAALAATLGEVDALLSQRLRRLR